MSQGFNPRARDGRENERVGREINKAVSIHAPVMDANVITGDAVTEDSFNPRARDGREVISMVPAWRYDIVSIHAPVMDAKPHHLQKN